MSDRTDAGKPRIIMLNDWFRSPEDTRIYGLTDERRYINAPYDMHADNKFAEGGRVVGFEGVQFILGRPAGQLPY